MEYSVSGTFNHTAEIAASAYPGLRLVTVAKVQKPTPQADALLDTYGWGVSSPATTQDPTHPTTVFGVPFSATCYYFGRELHLALGKSVPIGLLSSSWGGCAIEPWMRAGALAKCGGGKTPGQNGGMFNAMMSPFQRLRFAGMVWDQGEANTNDPPKYSCLFPAAIRDWRSFFSEPSLPLLFVQIGPSSSGRLTDVYGNRNDSYGMPLLELRQSQLQALPLPNVGMATAVDLGDPGCKAGQGGCMGLVDDNGRFGGHPRVKQPVGTRLASQALRIIYGRRTAPELEAPVVGAATLSGSTLTVALENVNQRGLRLRNTT